MNEKIIKIDIITRPSKLEELQEELNKIGITGMTVSNVLGCGTQKGHKEYYRGVTVDIHLIPKIKIEIVVCDISVDLIVDTTRKVLKTGKYGDGKIFIYDVANVIRIRDGEEGKYALKDENKITKKGD